MDYYNHDTVHLSSYLYQVAQPNTNGSSISDQSEEKLAQTESLRPESLTLDPSGHNVLFGEQGSTAHTHSCSCFNNKSESNYTCIHQMSSMTEHLSCEGKTKLRQMNTLCFEDTASKFSTESSSGNANRHKIFVTPSFRFHVLTGTEASLPIPPANDETYTTFR